MPIVPRLEPQQRTGALPSVRVNTTASEEAFGGGAAAEKPFELGVDTLQNEQKKLVAQDAEKEKIYQAAKKRADDVVVQDFDLGASKAVTDSEKAAFALKGKDAAQAPDIAMTAFQKSAELLKKGLYNDDQRAAAEKLLRAHQSALYDSVQSHALKEAEAYDTQQTGALVDNYQNDSAASPDRAKRNIFIQEQAIAGYGQRRGWGPEQIAAEQAKARSTTHVAVVTRMLADDQDAAALAYATAHEKELRPDDLGIIDRIRREQRARRAVQDQTYRNDLQLRVFDAPPGDRSALLDELDTALKANRIDRGEHATLRKRLMDVNDDPSIAADEKTDRFFQIVDRYEALHGARADDRGPSAPARGNSADDLRAFRNFVTESAPYLTKAQQKAFLTYTEQDMDDAAAGKWKGFFGIARGLKDMLRRHPGTPPSVVNGVIEKSMATLDPGTPVEQALVNQAKVKDSAAAAINPRRSQYHVDQIVTINKKSYVVTGFDADGEPLVAPAAKAKK